MTGDPSRGDPHARGVSTPEAHALRPLWLLTTGAAIGAVCVALTEVEPPGWLPPLLLATGVGASILAVTWKRRARLELWLLAGLSLVCGRGLVETGAHLRLERLVAGGETPVRARVVVSEGWIDARWGRRTRARVILASRRGERIRFPPGCQLEIQGKPDPELLPPPGSEIDVLARVRGDPRRPLLVVSSYRLVRVTGTRRLLPALREGIASRLFRAAGTDPGRIRAAEMASALALGRRDLIPVERRDRWRRSGLAHVLAVSGLHVGLVGGAAWLALALAGASPRTTRLAVLVIVPCYAVLAGAAPSAMRAALMASIYLGARLIGRAILPMAAVLLAVTILLVARPALVTNVGFQLTVVITAALVRWVAVVSRALHGPRWLAGVLAVPAVAQVAAAPLVAGHFRSLIPGAVIANVFALPLLAPTILGSVAAAAVAPLWSGAARIILDLVGALLVLLHLAGAPARGVELFTPALPTAVVITLAAAGWLGLQAGRWARVGAVAWLGIMVSTGLLWYLHRPSPEPTVELLSVTDGAAVIALVGNDAVLADSGRYRREAAQLLAEGSSWVFRAVLASHTDEDHLGGLAQVLRSFEVGRLVMPAWMLGEPQVVPLLRIARRRGIGIQPVASGSMMTLGSLRLIVLWPPARDPPRPENERSLVVRTIFETGSALLTADIGRSTERRLADGGPLRADVLVVPHHGGGGSTSPVLLDAAAPSLALIPAAPGNTHGHPHRAVLERLSERGIPTRFPARDGRCGARWNGDAWEAFP